MDLDKLKENCLKVCDTLPICNCCKHIKTEYDCSWGKCTWKATCSKTQNSTTLKSNICEYFDTYDKTCLSKYSHMLLL